MSYRLLTVQTECETQTFGILVSGNEQFLEDLRNAFIISAECEHEADLCHDESLELSNLDFSDKEMATFDKLHQASPSAMSKVQRLEGRFSVPPFEEEESSPVKERVLEIAQIASETLNHKESFRNSPGNVLRWTYLLVSLLDRQDEHDFLSRFQFFQKPESESPKKRQRCATHLEETKAVDIPVQDFSKKPRHSAQNTNK